MEKLVRARTRTCIKVALWIEGEQAIPVATPRLLLLELQSVGMCHLHCVFRKSERWSPTHPRGEFKKKRIPVHENEPSRR